MFVDIEHKLGFDVYAILIIKNENYCRGDSAFCSSECREQQMKHDERKDKCRVASSKKQVAAKPNSGSQVTTNTKGETVVAL